MNVTLRDIETAMVFYDGNGDYPYCDLVWQALKEKRERMIADEQKDNT